MADFEIHNLDVKLFIEALDTCKGDVFLETEEGDILNLKSKLSQMMGIAKILEGAVITDAKIRCSNLDDESKLFRLNLYHNIEE